MQNSSVENFLFSIIHMENLNSMDAKIFSSVTIPVILKMIENQGLTQISNIVLLGQDL